MNPTIRTRGLLLGLVALSAIVVAACSSDGPSPTPTPSGPSGGPIAFPYIFGGNFTVAGEPGPQGIPMFARLGDRRGPFNNSVRPGEYTNVSVTPPTLEDIGGEITFYLGHPDGSPVQAAETFVFTASVQPRFIELDLSFPRLP